MIECQKELFTLDEEVHYLNCAYKAPLLKSAEKSCIQSLIRERNPFQIETEDFFETTQKIKSEFSKLINCSSNDIALIPSTSYGFISVLNNIEGKNNGTAIIGLDEFPSGYYSLERWASEKNQNLIVNKTNEEILKAISKKTSVVLISTIHWQNGYVFDLKAIGDKCHEMGAYLIVDGTQSVGALPIDIELYKIHALICASYKWLFGPYSMAIAYINEVFHSGKPLEEAWINRTNYKSFSNLTNYVKGYRPKAGRFNVGETSNFILSPILYEGLKQINLWSPTNIQKYCSILKAELIEGIEDLEIENQVDQSANHLFSISLPDEYNIQKVQQQLLKNNVIVSIRKGSLRISINVFNTKNDIHKLIEVLGSKKTVYNIV